MIKRIHVWLFLLYFYGFPVIFPGNELLAQFVPSEVVPSNMVHIDNNRVFFLHHVKQGHTIYSISKAYGITQGLVLEANPGIADGLRTDQTIKIPAFIYHVQPQETVFGLSRRYGLTMQQLQAFNPEILTDGLKVGMVLYIPGKDPRYEAIITSPGVAEQRQDADSRRPDADQSRTPGRIREEPYDHGIFSREKPSSETDTTMVDFSNLLIDRQSLWWRAEPCIYAAHKGTYHVALLIPLYLEEVAAYQRTDAALMPEYAARMGLQHKSFSFLSYYQGVLLALDSIRLKGVDIRLHVYDVDQQEVKARQVVSRPDFRIMDLIIGPFFESTLRYVADFALVNGIPLVSPLEPSQNHLVNYPNVIKATPSIEIQLKQLARYIGKQHHNDNIILVHNNRPDAMPIIHAFKHDLNRELVARSLGTNRVYQPDEMENGGISDSTVLLFREHIHDMQDISGLLRKMEASRSNIVITLAAGEAFLANYLRELNIHSRNFDVRVFGIPQWIDYQSLDIDYLQNLKVHIFTNDFQDYSRQHIRDFVLKYRQEFGSEPPPIAFRGVHTAYFCFTALALYGKPFTGCIPQLNRLQILSPFSLTRPFGNEHGWENGYLNLIRFENFRMVDVNP